MQLVKEKKNNQINQEERLGGGDTKWLIMGKTKQWGTANKEKLEKWNDTEEQIPIIMCK